MQVPRNNDPIGSKISGLTTNEVLQSRALSGRNEMDSEKNGTLTLVLDLVREPMILLLLASAAIYFFSGQTGDAIFMLAGIVFVAGISLYQQSRSENALATLRSLNQPVCKVIREGKTIHIPKEEVVVGDCMVVEEGGAVPADGVVLQSNDFSVNESILTGESLPVEKDGDVTRNLVFQGTTVVRGLAICRVSAVGKQTALGQIGQRLKTIKKDETPLQKQIGSFVKKMAAVGLAIFLLMLVINYLRTSDLVASLLQALTLAMSILPEEIPVAFTTFMALGAWRLMKRGVIVRSVSTVETLGSATVICVDKTGTITENQMSLSRVFSMSPGKIVEAGNPGPEEVDVITYGMWSSEPIPFDPMEVALHEAYSRFAVSDQRSAFRMVHEYPLEGRPPMMTHIFENGLGKRIIAAKGAPEAIMKVCRLSIEERGKADAVAHALMTAGYRVLGVGISDYRGDKFPERQQELSFEFKGFLAFFDPPKQNIKEVLEAFYKAGILVKIITGDNAATTAAIAKQINFRGFGENMSGEELVLLADDRLADRVNNTNVFTRMFPEAKLRILNALKAKGHIVAMTGDGVNDGPALKVAHIGIAMGKKGSELAKEVSSLVLTDDDLSRMVDAIAMGRRIYTNLKKAIQYIISIHIPIILTVFLPLVLGWPYPSLLTPVHVIFLELIMGPTCSIIYENEPMEKNAMLRKPRALSRTFFNWRELSLSIIQGVVITLGSLFVYQYGVYHGYSETVTRTIVFITLVFANIFLTLVNRSFYYSIATTIHYKNPLIAVVIVVTLLLTVCTLYITPFARFFAFQMPGLFEFLFSVVIGFVSTIWFEGVKAWRRARSAGPE